MKLAMFLVVTWALIGCIAAILFASLNLRGARTSLLAVMPRPDGGSALPSKPAAPARLTAR